MSESPANPSTSPASPVFSAEGEVLAGMDGASFAPHNFRNPGFLSPADLRQLGVLHQRFVQHLNARLSTFLRMECALTVGKFNSATFATYCEGLPTPAHLSLFQIAPLRGIGIVNFSLPLGLAMADRLLGGKGKAPAELRTLTEIEVALVEDAIHLILTEWTHLWADDPDEAILRPECIGHETSARFLQTSAPDAVFVIMEVEMVLGDITSQFSMGIPFSMIEAEVKKMQQARLPGGGDEVRQKTMQWRSTHAHITVPVYAEWQVREMTLLEALQIREGDLIQLSPDLIDKTRVRLNTTEKFFGRVGVQNGCVAVQIGEKISEE